MPPDCHRKGSTSFLIGSYFRKRRFHDFGYPSVCVREQVTIYPRRDCRSSIDLSTPSSADLCQLLVVFLRCGGVAGKSKFAAVNNKTWRAQCDKRRGQRGIRQPCRGPSVCTAHGGRDFARRPMPVRGQRQTWGAPAERSGLFSVGRVYFTGMPVRRRSVAGSLPRRGVGCCVPQLTHLRSQDIHRRQPLGRSGFLAPAPPCWPGLFFWWRRSCCGERRPSVPLTQIKATDALLRMIKVGSGGAKLPGAAVIDPLSHRLRVSFPGLLHRIPVR